MMTLNDFKAARKTLDGVLNRTRFTEINLSHYCKKVVDKSFPSAYNRPQQTGDGEKYPARQTFREPPTVGTGRRAAGEWTPEGELNGIQVGEPEGNSVIKAGVCWYALSGRFSASSRVAPQELTLLSQRKMLWDRGVLFLSRQSERRNTHERSKNPLQDLPV